MNDGALCGCLNKNYGHNSKKYNDIKEMISLQYLGALCSYLGATCKQTSRYEDKDGIDADVTGPSFEEENIIQTNPKISFQLKSTSSPEYDKQNRLLLRLNIKNYDELVAPRTIPFILAVLVLPIDIPDWVSTTDDYLAIAKKMYWLNVKDTEYPVTAGQGSVTLHIPPSNVLTTKSLHDMIYKTARGVVIKNDFE